ncbi:hypothetical protein E4T52_02554 [Aureobasidium sp. EXF-3400]|nr:hypothetical protein E4T51_01829 [Aureobasidium sp. EXF-12344]KAI4782497.1 hypothetical protein E4T52_02554 [Aureobasidium sp. EXF-3400]
MDGHSRGKAASLRGSSGSAKEDSPTRGKAKRQQIAVACNACRRRKTKCDGHRPVCTVCVSKNSECTWSADPDATPMVAIKRKYQNLELESRDFHDLIGMLMDRPRQEAISILDHMRRTRDASSTLAFIKDGDLLSWGRSAHDTHPSDSTTGDQDSVGDITHRVNNMNGRDDMSVGSNESLPEPSYSPKRRLAISDLVND